MSEFFPGSAYQTDLVPYTNLNAVSDVSMSLKPLKSY